MRWGPYLTLPGYEHNGLTIATIWMFTARRRATPQEMEQGEDEMRRAQERLDAEVAAGAELPLEDKGTESQGFESPKVTQREETKGREEIPDVPKNSPKALMPAVPETEPPKEPPITQESPIHQETVAEVRSQVKTPKSSPTATQPRGALEDQPVGASSNKPDLNAGAMDPDVKGRKGIGNGPTPHSGRPGVQCGDHSCSSSF